MRMNFTDLYAHYVFYAFDVLKIITGRCKWIVLNKNNITWSYYYAVKSWKQAQE